MGQWNHTNTYVNLWTAYGAFLLVCVAVELNVVVLTSQEVWVGLESWFCAGEPGLSPSNWENHWFIGLVLSQ